MKLSEFSRVAVEKETGLRVLTPVTAENDKELSGVFCCDLLSICMAKVPADSIWVTVMGNINAVAVAALTDAACIILAENADLDEAALQRAEQQNIVVFQSGRPVFDVALDCHQLISRNGV